LVFALVRMANNMPELFGTGYPRAGLLRRVGRLEQVAGVRLVTLGDGQGRGVRVLEFRTGTGFAFEVLIDRCFDVGRCELAGQPLSWLSGAGVTGPWYYEPDDWGWFRAWGGGMVVTCGLDHTLGPAEDTAAHFNQPHIQPSVRYGLHGRAGGLPARLAGYGERWEGDECVLWAEGEVLQSAVFAEQLVLRRRIEARVGASRFTIHDVVENTGHTPASHMFLYHCNAGFPVLDEGAELVVPSRRTSTDYGVPANGYQTMSGPVRGATEACFEHELVAEPEGTVPVGLLNPARGLGSTRCSGSASCRTTRCGGCWARALTRSAWSPARTGMRAGRTPGSAVSCSGSSPARRASMTWRSARCRGRPLSMSSGTGCPGCFPQATQQTGGE
jgi:hypothetical protein